jgi:RHS repeat-associated protein
LKGKYFWGTMPVAFYNPASAAHFEHQDWLGTERMRTAYNGGVEGTFTSLPFGDAQTPPGVSGDANNFATLDYDAETSTDHAQFRQYSSTQGNWLSPDPYQGSYDFANPQSFNRYAYAGNSPLAGVDPSGWATRVKGFDGPNGGSFNPAPWMFIGEEELYLFDGGDDGCRLDETGLPLCPGSGSLQSLQPPGMNSSGTDDGASSGIWDDQFGLPYGGVLNGIEQLLGLPTMADINCLPFCDALGNAPNSGYWSTYWKLFSFKDLGKDVWSCISNVGLPAMADDLNPGDELGYSAGFGALSAGYYNAALVHAASRGLTTPLRSSIYRGLMKQSEGAAEAAPVAILDQALLAGVIAEAKGCLP